MKSFSKIFYCRKIAYLKIHKDLKYLSLVGAMLSAALFIDSLSEGTLYKCEMIS